MIFTAFALTFNLTQRFSLGTQNRFTCKFGSKRLLVLLLACETLLPDIGFLPVTAQTFAMVNFLRAPLKHFKYPSEDGQTSYDATLHSMVARVDSGRRLTWKSSLANRPDSKTRPNRHQE